MRVDNTATLKRGERCTQVDTKVVEEKVNEVAGLLRRLENVNAVQRGTLQNHFACNSPCHLERRQLLSDISSILGDVLSKMPPSCVLPQDTTKGFEEINLVLQSTGLLEDEEGKGKKKCEAEPRRERTEEQDKPETVPSTEDTGLKGSPPTIHLLLETSELVVGTTKQRVPKSSSPNTVMNGPYRNNSTKTKAREVVKATVRPATMPQQRRKKNANLLPESKRRKLAKGFASPASFANFAHRTTHLPFIQRIILNIPPKNTAIGVERDVTPMQLVETLQNFALRPESVLKGETPVNKTAACLYMRIREKNMGSRDVVSEQIERVTREFAEEQERRLREIEANLPSQQTLAARLKEPYDLDGIKRLRMNFMGKLNELYPDDIGCSDQVLRRFINGKYDLSKRPRWRHAIHEVIKDHNNRKIVPNSHNLQAAGTLRPNFACLNTRVPGV